MVHPERGAHDAIHAETLHGVLVALATVATKANGSLSGLTVSAFNQVRGGMRGLAVGIVNYAWTLRGLQIGLVNIVRGNPRGLRVLPLFNANF